MDLSVVVCSLNRAASLRRTLRALEAQKMPAGMSWEVVVVDNGSSDGTDRALDAFAASTKLRFVRCFVAERGLSRARNAGLRAARGAVVAFTDDDVSPAPDWVANLLQVLAETPADMLGGRIVPLWEQPPPDWIRSSELVRELAIQENETAVRVVEATQSPTVWGANMAFRRAVFDRIGEFDVRWGVRGSKLFRGDETELVSRALAGGFSAIYDPRPVVFHHIPKERLGIAYFSRLRFERAQGIALARNGVSDPGALAASLSPGKGLAFVAAKFTGAAARFGWAAARRSPELLLHWLDTCAAAGALFGDLERRYRL